MPYEIQNHLTIDAPPEIVWEVITDLTSYREWNSFVPEASSTFEIGSPFAMKVQLFESFAQSQRETVFEFEPGRRFRYGVAGGRFSPVRSSRTHSVEACDGGRTSYCSDFEIAGWLSPLVRLLTGRLLQRGFDSMAAGLQTRAEALHAVRRELTKM